MEALGLIALTGLVATAFVWTKAPLYNPGWTIDPWLYTALWTNFEQIYHAFAGTYYVSRLPWIVPGYTANELFNERVAYFVVHGTFFVGGGLLFYVMCRRYLGRVAAACGYLALVGNGLYFSAHRWDYLDGAIITFLIASAAFALPRRRTLPSRALSLGLSGLFSAALVTTRIVDAVYLIGLPILYWAVMLDGGRRERWRNLRVDVTAYAIGACILVLGGGVFAHRHGSEFLFFMPQVRVALSTSGEANQVPVGDWLPVNPYFFVPLFAIALAVLVLVQGRPADVVPRRFLIAATAWTSIAFASVSLWEFVGSGWVFEYGYYFNSFLLPTILCLAGSVRALLGPDAGENPSWSSRAGVVAVAAAAVLGPILWIYRSDSFARVAHGVLHGAYLATLVFMGVALCVAFVALIRRSTSFGAVAVFFALLAASQGIDASNATYLNVASDPRAGPEYRIGSKLVRYLRHVGYNTELPYFWYDDTERNYQYRGFQSLYYYAFTYVDVSMPKIGADFRARMHAIEPKKLVLLCPDPGCRNGPAALAQAGYKPRELSRRQIVAGTESVWVVIYAVRSPRDRVVRTMARTRQQEENDGVTVA